MNKLTVTLKQHTPLIHFQHDQEGATLRASEVKPKLDRFLLTKLGEGDYEVGKQKAKDNGWLIGKGEHGALDYKLSLNAKNKNSSSIEETYKKKDGRDGTLFNPLYFANMGKKEHEKLFFVDNESVVLKISTFNLSLKEEIEKYICEFFFCVNFGSRSDKGFGSYYLDPKDPLHKDVESLNLKASYIDIESIDNKIIWETINYYYRRLKSGISRINEREQQPYLYQKSYLRKSNSNINWEKKFVKSVYLGNLQKDDKHVFLRAILGLPGSLTFRKGNIDMYGKDKFRDQIEVEITSKDKAIERISSPILFKPIKKEKSTSIFIHVNDLDIESYDYIKNVDFYFQLKFKFEYYEIGRDNERRKKSKLIPLGSNFDNEVTSLMETNSVDNGQVERLKSFLNNNYPKNKMSLRLPLNNISIRSLLNCYHEKELKFEFDVKYKNNSDNNNSNYQTIKAKIIKS